MSGPALALARPRGAPPPQSGVDLSILQLGAEWFPECHGGGENMFYNLSRTLPGAGVAVRGLVAGSAAVAEQSAGSVTAFATAASPLPTRLWRVRRAVSAALAAGAPDLVTSHFALYAAPALDLLRRHPWVVHFHGPWATESRAEGANRIASAAKAALEKAVYGRGDRFIVLSQQFGSILHTGYGVSWSRIDVVPGGVDCVRFATVLTRPVARERLGWPADRPIILTVRRLVRRMGLRGLVAAMAMVRQKAPDALLLIAGKGEQAGPLQTMIDELGLQDSVRLLGFVPDELLPLAYRSADLTIVPSTELEGFGLTTVESLAAGTPVLVTPVGGLPETVAGLAPQLVLAGSEPTDLADGLAGALLGSLPVPDAISCRSFAKAQFDWPVIAQQTKQVYLNALR